MTVTQCVDKKSFLITKSAALAIHIREIFAAMCLLNNRTAIVIGGRVLTARFL